MPIEITYDNVREFSKNLRDILGRDVKHTQIIDVLATTLGRRPDAMMHELKSEKRSSLARAADGSAVFSRTPVDRRAVAEWALRNGFEGQARGRLVAPLPHNDSSHPLLQNQAFNGKVMLYFEGDQLEVWCVDDVGVEVRMNCAMVSDLFIDQFDMLHGAGLFTRYYSLYKETGVWPVWFSKAMRDNLLAAASSK